MSSQGDRQPFKVSPTQAPPRQVQPPQPRVPQVPQVTQQVESRPATKEELLAWHCELLAEQNETLKSGVKTVRDLLVAALTVMLIGGLLMAGVVSMSTTVLADQIRRIGSPY